MAEPKAKLSFGFLNKKTDLRPISKVKLRDDVKKEAKDAPDFVLSIEDKKIESSNAKPTKSELIIPLIVKNHWRLPSTASGSNIKSAEGASDIDRQAVQEILKATHSAQNSNDDAVNESQLVIPVFVQNQVPKGYETDEKVDVSLRAEESSIKDYESVPIEEYGVAMLKGMGWKPGEGIGLKNKKVVEPPEATLRPKGLGLGADSRAKLNVASLLSDKGEEAAFEIAVGSYVKILKGPHKDLYGQVDGLDVENARVVVKLALTSKNITISEFLVTAVTNKEYKKEGRIINKAKYDKYKVKAEESLSKQRTEMRKHEEESLVSYHKSRSASPRDERGTKRSHSPDEVEQKSRSASVNSPWMRPLLRVRFIDRTYKNGKYYNSKFVIEDVVNSRKCICRTDSGRILEDIPEKWLETLIPKKHPLIVMVVRGVHNGQLGEILQKERSSCTATVQLLQEKNVVQLDYDSIYDIEIPMLGSVCRLLIHSAEQLVCIADQRQRVLKGTDMNNIVILQKRNTDGLSIVIGKNGLILDLGYDSVVRPKYHGVNFENVIDASGKCVLPGLIDGHTHPVWAGERVDEFAMKVAGATYMEIHRAGGGIHFTVECTRQASFEDLYKSLEQRLLRMLKCGTTVVECKSGYGLEPDTEVKMLRVLEKAKHNMPLEISSTFCGAHAIPKGMTALDATRAVIEQQLPAVQRLMARSELKVDHIDVFCEEGVFNVEQTREILMAGREAGLAINFHGDELHPLNSAVMGAEIGARAISHLEEISDEGITVMAQKEVVAVVLPATAYILRLKAPPVRKMIDEGVPVALGTDFNPNAFCLSMPLAMHFACINFHMSLNEALVAATLNAAASIGRAATNGSLERGKHGDLIILNETRWEHLIYQMASHDHLIKYVIKNGLVVVAK